MSRQDKLDVPKIDNVPPDGLDDDDRLQIDLRLSLDKVAAAEEEKLRRTPRRRPNRLQLLRLAHQMYTARRDRAMMFRADLFGEPAWDMLLALYCLPQLGEVLAVTSLSNAAGVPQATGLRWQKKLLEEGLLKRGPHVLDDRTQLVGLTQQGRLLMEEYLTRLFHCQGTDVPRFD